MQINKKSSSPKDTNKKISDAEIFAIVEDKKPEKLAIIQAFGTEENYNSTLKEVIWTLKKCAVGTELAHAWLTRPTEKTLIGGADNEHLAPLCPHSTTN